MANIGQFKVGTEWTKLYEVTGYTFAADSSYTIQNKEYQALLVCEGADAPEGDNVGFILQTGQPSDTLARVENTVGLEHIETLLNSMFRRVSK